MEEQKQISQEFSEEQEESFDDSETPDRSLNDELDKLREQLPYHQRDSVISLLQNDNTISQEKENLIQEFQAVYGHIEDTDPEKLAIMLFLSQTLGISIPKKNNSSEPTLDTLSIEDNEQKT